MAGNRRVYDAAIKRAANLAWDQKWSRAIQEYNRALEEFPQDVTALTGLGLAYAETQQLELALDTYKQAANLSPENPEVIQRVGQMFERLAQWPNAAGAYVMAADAYLNIRDISQAIEMWRKAVVLDPENLKAHRSLAKVYRNQKETRRAARHHLIMARILARQNKTAQAIEEAQLGIDLDPRNGEALGILNALKAGKPLPDGPTARLQPDEKGKRTLESFVVFDDIELGTGPLVLEDERATPADTVCERSLEALAGALFSDDADPKAMRANLVLGQAADFQARGLVERAIEAYESALKLNAGSPAVHFNLGLLYQEQGEFESSIEYLDRALADPEYGLGTHFALGESYYRWGKASDALQHLLQVLLLVDSETVLPEHLDALEQAYEQLYFQYSGPNESADTRRFVDSIISFLSIKGWEKRLMQVRKQLDNLAGGGLVVTLAEMLTEPSAETAMVAMSQVERYLRKDLVFTALEECFWAIQQSPYYLPLHLRLADILIAEGKLNEAVEKYITVATTYKTRGNVERAIAIYYRALDTMPMNIGVREQLIEILLDGGFIDQAIEQFINVADAYYQLAQVDQAIVKYNRALDFVDQGDPDRHWEANILHRIGDIHMQRVNWRDALRIYRRIKRLEPQDDRARTILIDLYYKLEQTDNAVSELDELIELHREKQDGQKLLTTLQEMSNARPSELTLHMRLARTYLSMKMKKEAIAELDTIGELQLESGMTQEAIRTIQAIIRLNPENIQGYRHLLAQLKTQ